MKDDNYYLYARIPYKPGGPGVVPVSPQLDFLFIFGSHESCWRKIDQLREEYGGGFKYVIFSNHKDAILYGDYSLWNYIDTDKYLEISESTFYYVE